MAEFQEVMRQLGRICATNFGECDICDLRPFCPAKTFLDKYVKSSRTQRLEEKVLAWAAEHPEPVYPTWAEWLESQGILAEIGHIECGGCGICGVFTEKGLQPIHADMADKLGLKPKEG